MFKVVVIFFCHVDRRAVSVSHYFVDAVCMSVCQCDVVVVKSLTTAHLHAGRVAAAAVVVVVVVERERDRATCFRRA